MQEEPVPLASGSTFGPYRVMEQLGKGGMASVYRAYEAALDRYVALKVLPKEFLHDDTFAERFQREAKVIAKLEHANIIPIFSFGLEDKTPWMAMRCISGGTLSSLMKTRRLTYPEVIKIIRSVAEALEYAHSKGVVHRDVKPQNVLLDETGGVYLAHFGIARMVESGPGLTATGMITGTPNYMAPEQATGGHIDHRCDIYALGVMSYEMLTGQVPFSADTPVAVLMKHVSDPIPLAPANDVPEPMFRAVLKCLAKKSEDRWAQATDFAKALETGQATSPTMAPGPTVMIPSSSGGSVTSTRPSQPRTATVPSATTPGYAPAPTTLTPSAPPPRSSSALPIVAGLGVLGVFVLLLLGGGAWWFLRSSTSTTESPATPAPSSPDAPMVPETNVPATGDPVVENVTPSAAPPAVETMPPTTTNQRPVADTRVAAAPNGGTTPPIAAAPEPTTTTSSAPMSPSLDVDLEIVQDPSGPWASSVLYAWLKVDDNGPSKALRMDFNAGPRLRQRVVVPNVTPGAHEITVAVSRSADMSHEATCQGSKEIALLTGVTPLGITVRFLGPEDWTIKFR